ncbi:MAG: hypothetical protein PCFJNLEI_03222 [Verrucomicrobiae bacterium]|nr:hypothetical protein [Verrucomicrobiae bacterium]
MIAVRSSNLKAVDYDDDGLLVDFHGGRRYRFYGVPYDKFTGLLNAGSKGEYFAAHIKGRYRYRRIR